ncbi:hypothetical protein REPUB_Repub04eG0215700 [Reevesia pubescens]
MPGDEDFRKAWQKDETLWTGSEDESDSKCGQSRLEREIRKVRQQAKEHSELIDADEVMMDIQARMRDPNNKFSPELKLQPKSKLVPRKKWQKAQLRRRKAQKR